MYEDIIHRWKIANPILSQGLGFHEFDGDVPNLSHEYIRERISELKKDIAKLHDMDNPSDKISEFEFNLVLSALEMELFDLDTRKDYLKSAAYYVAGWFNTFNMIQKSHTQRSFATINERVRSITAMESKFPEFLEQAEQNLSEVTLSVAATKSSLNFVSGYISYYQDELIEFISQASDETLIQEWSEVNQRAIDAFQSVQRSRGAMSKRFIDLLLSNSVSNFA